METPNGSAASTLRRPTADVAATVEHLVERGFEVVATSGQPTASFGNQLVRLSDGSTDVTITRDRGQWMCALQPAGWSSAWSLDLVLAVLEGTYRETEPTVDPGGAMPGQLPIGVTWLDAVPRALEWATGGSHREVIVTAGASRRADLRFGSLPGRPSLDDIGRWVGLLARAVGAPAHLLPAFGRGSGMGDPHLESSGSGFAYVVSERGRESSRVETDDPLRLLELCLGPVTFSMASTWESQHRHPSDDHRRRLFATQLVMLQVLHPPWAAQRAIELGPLLADAGLDPRDAAEVVADAEG